MNTRRALTDKQERVLRCIVEYQKKHGFSPSIRDLCEMTGIKSTSTVHAYLKKLETRGYIERMRECPRALTVIKF